MKRNFFGIWQRPWAILPDALHELATQMTAIDAAALRNIDAATVMPRPATSGAVRVIPILGTIVPNAGPMLEAWVGVSGCNRITRELREAMADPSVERIVLNIDSPGGSVDGVLELASEVLASRGTKPITAVANSMMASAAYWIGCAADEIVVTPSASVGSIGVIVVHEEVSGMLANMGVGVEMIRAGKFKGEGNPFQPLTDEARTAIQTQVDYFYDLFVTAVARGRNVNAAQVRNGFGEGRVVNSAEAVALGMADRVGSLEDVVLGRGGRRRSPRADMDLRQRRLRLAGAGSVE